MSNHNIMDSTNDNTTMMNNKPKRKSVQFGRVSYSDDSNEKELSQHQHHENSVTPFKFMERSAMCSSVAIPPPCPPQRKASAEVVLVDGEIDDFGSISSSSSISIVTSLMESLVTSETSEEEKETDDSDSSNRYISPLITMRKTISPGAPTRTRPRLGVSPSQLPTACFPARCL